mgnify:CR=1 FL=1
MKKIILSLMIFLLLVGCSNAKNIENEQLARYESYWNSHKTLIVKVSLRNQEICMNIMASLMSRKLQCMMLKS